MYHVSFCLIWELFCTYNAHKMCGPEHSVSIHANARNFDGVQEKPPSLLGDVNEFFLFLFDLGQNCVRGTCQVIVSSVKLGAGKNVLLLWA
jgi:hypothetical protein